MTSTVEPSAHTKITKRRKGLGITALTAVVLLALAACSADASDSGVPAATDTSTSAAAAGPANPDATLVIGSTNEPTSLTRNVGGSSGIAQTTLRNVYEGLTALDPKGVVIPALAESWDVSEDGLTYTFHLRDGVTFDDGTALSADDVVYSLKEAIAPESKSARKSDLSVMKDITATDATTVTVVLSRPSQSLPFNLANAAVTIVKTGDKEYTKNNGTGPYKLVEWVQGDHLTIARNDSYWGDAPKNKEVTFRFFKDTTALNNALAAGDIDLVISEDSPDQLAQFENNADFKITEGTSTTKQLWAFNDKVAPFNNPVVRQALYQAIDRDALLDTVWAGYGQVIGSMVPPSDPWYTDEVLKTNEFNADAAKQKLADAGVTNLTISLDYVVGDTDELIAQSLQEDLKAIGVTLTLNPIDDATWYQKIYTDHDFQTTIMNHVNPRDVVWYANPDFYWGYDNKDVQQWVAQADEAKTADEQTALLKKVNIQIADDAASAWLYLVPQLRVASSKVAGYPVDQVVESFYVADITKSA